jgi:hypothetical protein
MVMSTAAKAGADAINAAPRTDAVTIRMAIGLSIRFATASPHATKAILVRRRGEVTTASWRGLMGGAAIA